MDEQDDADACEYFAERAAIMEIEGGLRRHQAEFYATVATWRYCLAHGICEPHTTYYVIVSRYFRGDEQLAPDDA